MEARQNIDCDPKAGLTCWNMLNWETWGCHDYEVRFFCPCGESKEFVFFVQYLTE